MADFYTQCPNMLIFGLPDLSNNDRMVMLSLMYLAWGDEEPLQISIRDLAKFTHVSPSVLCDSAKNEEEKQRQIAQDKFREGSLTRLSRLGYITVEEDGNKTYIIVHLSKIWEDNAAFRKQHGVPNSNTIKSKGVRKSNTSVRNSNSETPSSVLQSNTDVRKSNDDDPQNGSTSGSSEPLRIDKKLEKERMKESDSLIHSSTQSFNHSSLPDFCLEKIEQVAQDCGEDADQYLAEAQRLYQQSSKSEDIFYDLLFNAEACINRYGPRTMQGFFDNMRRFLKAS